MKSALALAAAAMFVTAPLYAQTGSAKPPAAPSIPGSSKDLAATPAGAYKLDPSHTSVIWRVGHFGLSTYQGRFDKISGALSFDSTNPAASKLDVTIDTKSVSTGYRDAEGKPSFDEKIAMQAFGAEKNPTIRFVSKSVVRSGDTAGKVTGDLTLNGVTKPVTLDVTFNGGLTHPFAKVYVIGFSARGAIKRSEFGIVNWAGAVADDVELVIESEFQQEPKK